MDHQPNFSRAQTTLQGGLMTMVVIGVAILGLVIYPKMAGWLEKDKPTATATAPTPTSQVIEVDSLWVRANLLPQRWFQLDAERDIRVRLLDNREFTGKGERWVAVGGQDTTRLPNVIPGFSVRLRAADKKPLQVVLSTWPK
jgi:hypothetical protein